MEKQSNRTEKNKRFAQDSNLSRVISTLLSPSAICELFLFYSVLHVFLILLFNHSNEWIFKLNTISGYQKIGSPNLYICISLNQIFLLCECRFSLRKKSTSKSLTIIRSVFFYVDYFVCSK